MYGGLIASGWQNQKLLGGLVQHRLADDVLAAGHGDQLAIQQRFEHAGTLHPADVLDFRAGDRLSARYTVLVAEPSASRPTLGKVLGRTELVDEAGEVVYQMDGWGMIGRRPLEESTSS